jgi:hypothetical protein
MKTPAVDHAFIATQAWAMVEYNEKYRLMSVSSSGTGPDGWTSRILLSRNPAPPNPL